MEAASPRGTAQGRTDAGQSLDLLAEGVNTSPEVSTRINSVHEQIN